MGTEIAKHLGGRPLKLQNRRKVQEAIDGYFADCETNKEPVTLTGVCMCLGITRETFRQYANGEGDHRRISDIVKRAHQRVEQAYEKRGMTAQNPAFFIFVLKVMGWPDKQDIDINARLRPSSYTEEEETELREFARLRAISETTKALSSGSGE
jgi:hypothetical protein